MFVADCTVHPLKVKTEDEYTQEISGPTKYYSKLLCPAIGRQYLRGLEGAQQYFTGCFESYKHAAFAIPEEAFLRNNPFEDNLTLVLASRDFGMLHYDIHI